MKKIFITVGLLLASCSTHTDIIYSGRKVSKSIDNLQTMGKWLKHDLKDGVQVDHYEMLIDQTIYNLEQNIKPRRPIKDYSGLIDAMKRQTVYLEKDLNSAKEQELLSIFWHEILMQDIQRLRYYIHLIEE